MNMLTPTQKQKLITMMQNLKCTEWVDLNKYTQEEQAHLIFCIQNQKGAQFETNGISYQPETHTKFRRLDTNLEKYLNKN